MEGYTIPAAIGAGERDRSTRVGGASMGSRAVSNSARTYLSSISYHHWLEKTDMGGSDFAG